MEDDNSLWFRIEGEGWKMIRVLDRLRVKGVR